MGYHSNCNWDGSKLLVLYGRHLQRTEHNWITGNAVQLSVEDINFLCLEKALSIFHVIPPKSKSTLGLKGSKHEEKNRNKPSVGLELGKTIPACSEWATPLSPPLMKVHSAQLYESIWNRREEGNHSRIERECVLPLMNGTMPRQLLHKCQKWDLCCFSWIPVEVLNYRQIPHIMGFCCSTAMQRLLASRVFSILKLKP